MGDHTRVFTHKTKSIVNSLFYVQKIYNEISATTDQRLKWFMVNKSVNTLVHHRSYAEVLQTVNSKDKTTNTRVSTRVHKHNRSTSAGKRTLIKQPECVQPKCVLFKRNPVQSSSSGEQCRVGRNEVSKGKFAKQERTLELNNKFHILQSLLDDEHEGSIDGSHFISQLEGNKNETGQILGSEPQNTADNDVQFLKPFKGNKNKNGNKLGLHTHQTDHCYNFHQDKHTIEKFRGNKNGNRAKLGNMLHDQYVEPLISEAQAPPGDTQNNQVITGIQDLQECYDLSCIHQQEDEVIKIYDIFNPPQQRKRKIPEIVIHNKIYSCEHVNCVQQNGQHYGFLPLSDLMVYRGEEVVWAEVPSLAEAHKIIKHSKMPNFMRARIPIQSQLNITAWKFYLNEYWDKQIVDLLQYGFPLDFDRSQICKLQIQIMPLLCSFQTMLKITSKLKLNTGPSWVYSTNTPSLVISLHS